MQHIGKHRGYNGRPVVLFVAILVLIGAGAIALTFVNVPAPHNNVTQELDAKAFLEQK